MIYKRRPRKLILGAHYNVKFKWGNSVLCKFIQPTNRGFNLLNVKTNKCVLRNHLYPSKCENHLSETWFWLNDTINISKCENHLSETWFWLNRGTKVSKRKY